jgi:hypothetical protein
MTTASLTSTPRSSPRSSTRVRGARLAYAALAWLFVGGVVLQVFLAGMALLVDPLRIAEHRTFGHLVLLIPYGLLAAGLVARFPRRLFGLTALLMVLSLMHTSFVHVPADGDAGFVRAFHAVNALLLFWLGTHLARGSLRLPD